MIGLLLRKPVLGAADSEWYRH